jgi:hypothetical protein
MSGIKCESIQVSMRVKLVRSIKHILVDRPFIFCHFFLIKTKPYFPKKKKKNPKSFNKIRQDFKDGDKSKKDI